MTSPSSSITPSVRPSVQLVILVVTLTLLNVQDVQGHFTIRNVYYKTLVDFGLKQYNYWWPQSTQCRANISCSLSDRYRSANGSCNNIRHPQWGMADWPLDRLLLPVYEDGIWKPRQNSLSGQKLPSARHVSTTVHICDDPNTESKTLSNLMQVWGQYMDHDLTFTPQQKEIDGVKVKCCTDEENADGPEPYNDGVCFNIEIPPFDRYMTRRCMSLTRSKISSTDKTCGKRYREQLNSATSFLDASQVYGSSDEKQASLRDFTGGLLTVKYDNMLPETTDSSTCFPVDPKDYCLNAGDTRVNEHPGLSVLHTAFMREHNRIANELAAINPQWDDEKLYQESRKIVAAINQRITYWEWLPLLLGRETMHFFELGLECDYSYHPETNPTAFNAFPTAAFRYGHSQIPNDWTVSGHGVPLDGMFMRPYFILYDNGTGYDGLVNGMLTDPSQNVDLKFSKGVTDHLFETKDSLPLDLVSLNIQRGRDHGLPPYIFFRDICTRLTGETSQIPSDGYRRILQAYNYRLEDVDLFTGALAEYHLKGAQVGPTFACLIGLYFHRIKFGDRFWHQTEDKTVGFTQEQRSELTKATFARVICDTSHVNSTQMYVFETVSERNPVVDCAEIPSIDLSKWKE